MNLIFEHGIWSFANAEIWVGIGLIIFFGILIAAGVPKLVAAQLDAKAAKIQADLDEAARLRAEAEALVAEADTVCPYSHATRGNIDVTLTLVDE